MNPPRAAPIFWPERPARIHAPRSGSDAHARSVLTDEDLVSVVNLDMVIALKDADDFLDGLSELGRLAGSEQAQRWGAEANAYPPVLRTHDRFGHRIDEVEYHPSYHVLMNRAFNAGLHSVAWKCQPGGFSAPAMSTALITCGFSFDRERLHCN